MMRTRVKQDCKFLIGMDKHRTGKILVDNQNIKKQQYIISLL